MMKKILFFYFALLTLNYGLYSQNIKPNKNQLNGIINSKNMTIKSSSKVALMPSIITDTLHYFYNKQLYKIANISVSGFPYYKSGAATGTAITHVGSVFLNSENIVINGLEIIAAFNSGSATIHNVVRGRIYLCNVNAQNIPVLPAIDSVQFTVGGGQTWIGNPKGHIVGGNFLTARSVNSNFAVLARNIETTEGDTIRFLRTAAITQTASGNPSNKFGEGLGVLRNGGIFSKTTNFGLSSFGFGLGTDYEFCVAPRVTYTLQSNHIAPLSVQNNDSIECWQPLTFSNNSSSFLTSRFFNLNQFYLKWAPFASTPPGNFSADSAVSWSFDDEDIDNPYLRSSLFLKYGQNSVTKYYDTSALTGTPPSCFNNCKFKTRLRKMAAESGSSMVYMTDSTFVICVKSCGEVGINELSQLNNVKIYPNPLINNSTTVYGLDGKNTILIYNMIGQLVLSQLTDKDSIKIDLSKHPEGTYLLRILNADNKFKIVKIINQKN